MATSLHCILDEQHKCWTTWYIHKMSKIFSSELLLIAWDIYWVRQTKNPLFRKPKITYLYFVVLCTLLPVLDVEKPTSCANKYAYGSHYIVIKIPFIPKYRTNESNHVVQIRTSLQVMALQRECDAVSLHEFFSSPIGLSFWTVLSLSKLFIFQVAARKQRTAFPPNFVHSLDGSHMMMTALACRDAGLRFAGLKS